MGHSSGSGYFSADQLVENDWARHFEKTDCLWLLPLLKRIANGEAVGVDALLRAYEDHHGTKAEYR